jgi:hypothetical protein
MIPLRPLAALVVLASSAGPAFAHEFWIDAHRYRVSEGEAIVADLRVGEGFEGIEVAFLPAGFRRFGIVQGGTETPVEGRMGDRPALGQSAPGEGLAVVVHVTTDSLLTYQDFATFESFVRHKDAAWVLDAHTTRGLPADGVREGYSRHAKALIAVGAGAGADRALGLETEIVAEANPYTDDLSAGMPVRLLYKSAPRARAQVEVFERSPDGAIAVSTVRTNPSGRATVPVRPGHVYMLDAVVIREPEGPLAERPGVMWESLWANLTFAVPD